ncbi:hypothetical protein BT69DRAFT_1332953 [Atractiella rhizophila]|nr:hypothetical protein BT69DRAFT_1332953 [Atractiella rhizophila]
MSSIFYFRDPTSNLASAFISENRKVAGGAEDDGCRRGGGVGREGCWSESGERGGKIVGSGIGRTEVLRLVQGGGASCFPLTALSLRSLAVKDVLRLRSGKARAMPSIKFAATPPFDGTLEGFYNLQGDVYDRSLLSTALFDRSLIMSMLDTGPVGLLERSVARRSKDITVDIQGRKLAFAKSMWDRRSLFLRNRRRESKYRIAYSGRVAESMKEEVKVADRAGWHRPGRRLRRASRPPSIL